MSDKTLADELRSVLLARSLDAPEPTDTMRRILADTVGTVGTVDTVDTVGDGASHQPGRSDRFRLSHQPGGRVRPSWLRWPPSGFLIAAVTVALLVIGVGALARLGQSGSGPSSTAGGAAKANSAEQYSGAQDSGGRNSAGQGALPGPALSPRVQANGTQAPGGSTGQGNGTALTGPRPPFPKDLDCSSIGGGKPGIGAWAASPATPESNGLRFYEFRCSGPSGQRLASEVQEFRRTGPTLAYVQTLLPRTLNQHVDFISVDGAVLIQSANASGVGKGDVFERTYTLDSRPGYRVTSTLVARACTSKDLTTTATTSAEIRTTSGTVVSAHAVLQFSNRSYRPCAIEGFPAVRSMVGSRTVGPPTDTMLSGVGGGLRNSVVPPIVVLAPGSVAAAIVELGEWTGSSQCASTDRLAVSLPNGTVLPPVPVALGACAVTVHPVVDNPLGSD